MLAFATMGDARSINRRTFSMPAPAPAAQTYTSTVSTTNNNNNSNNNGMSTMMFGDGGGYIAVTDETPSGNGGAKAPESNSSSNSKTTTTTSTGGGAYGSGNGVNTSVTNTSNNNNNNQSIKMKFISGTGGGNISSGGGSSSASSAAAGGGSYGNFYPPPPPPSYFGYPGYSWYSPLAPGYGRRYPPSAWGRRYPYDEEYFPEGPPKCYPGSRNPACRRAKGRGRGRLPSYNSEEISDSYPPEEESIDTDTSVAPPEEGLLSDGSSGDDFGLPESEIPSPPASQGSGKKKNVKPPAKPKSPATKY